MDNDSGDDGTEELRWLKSEKKKDHYLIFIIIIIIIIIIIYYLKFWFQSVLKCTF